MKQEVMLTALAKLLAPRPHVHVFQLEGYRWAAIEDPDTFQVHIGLSVALWRKLYCHVMERTRENVADYVTVTWVPPGLGRLVLSKTVEVCTLPEESTSLAPLLLSELILEPQPVELVP
jgi:hypothetical protein